MRHGLRVGLAVAFLHCAVQGAAVSSAASTIADFLAAYEAQRGSETITMSSLKDFASRHAHVQKPQKCHLDDQKIFQTTTMTTAEPAAVTKHDILAIQSQWANAIANISATHNAGGDFIQVAAAAAADLYAYNESTVLFKPTKATVHQFRPTSHDALSYFVGGGKVAGGYEEDSGFAINSGKGWAKCVYANHDIVTKGSVAFAMGNYYFTCATTGDEVKVEYTFGYQRCADGKVRIFLHHSSLPYSIATV